MFRFIKYCYELKKVVEFKKTLERFYALESTIRSKGNNEYVLGGTVRVHQLLIHRQCKAKYKDEYDLLRSHLAESIPAIRRIAGAIGVHCIRESLPPPRVGGEIIPVCIFESVLEDLGYIETQYETRFDTLNKMIGILREARFAFFINIFNPFAWLRIILKTPVVLISTAGLNTDKIETGLWGAVFKVGSWILLIWLCLRWGFKPEHLTGVFK